MSTHVALGVRASTELELAGMKSAFWGLYLGLRLRLIKGKIRPFVGVGVPLFFYRDEHDPDMSTHVALGVRASTGLELAVHRHLSLQGDVGVEHFFNVQAAVVDGDKLERTLFVPTIGVIGRL